MHTTWMIATVALLAAACSKARTDVSTDSAQGMEGMAGMEHDADVNVAGTGVPAGYAGRVDRPDRSKIEDVKYTIANGQWEITTGPAHIVYAAGDTASGTYAVSTTIEQLEAPAHPEAYGIFFGGQQLDQPTQAYGYFEVRGTGEYLIKTRHGDSTATVVPWTASDAVPKQNANGKAVYAVTMRAGTDSVRFLVNDTPVAAVAAGALPTDGVAGLRVNHNLHLSAVPVRITR